MAVVFWLKVFDGIYFGLQKPRPDAKKVFLAGVKGLKDLTPLQMKAVLSILSGRPTSKVRRSQFRFSQVSNR